MFPSFYVFYFSLEKKEFSLGKILGKKGILKLAVDFSLKVSVF